MNKESTKEFVAVVLLLISVIGMLFFLASQVFHAGVEFMYVTVCSFGILLLSLLSMVGMFLLYSRTVAQKAAAWCTLVFVVLAGLVVLLEKDYLATDFLFRAKEYGAAAGYLEKLIAQNSIRDKAIMPVLYNQWGLCFYRRQQMERARTIFQEAIERYPDYYRTYNNLGLVYQALNNNEMAIEHFTRAAEVAKVAKNFAYANAYGNLGNLYGSLGDHAKAIGYYQQAIAADPADAETHYNLGNTYYAIKDYRLAMESFLKSLSLNRNHSSAMNNLGNVYNMVGDYRRALDLHKQSYAVAKNDITSLRNIGEDYLLLKQPQDAIDIFKTALREYPNDYQSMIRLGWALNQAGKYEEALNILVQARAIRADDPVLHCYFGITFKHRKEWEAAQKEYEAAISLDQASLDGYYGLAGVYWNKKDYGKAIEYYNKVLALEPKHAGSFGCLSRIAMERSDIPKALDYFDKASALGEEFDPEFVSEISRYR